MFSPDHCFLFSPPHPVNKFYYRCDRKFHLDDLLKLYEVHENYAIVLISGKRTELYLHNTNQTVLLKSLDQSLPNQHKTGGQSAQRFGRIRDEKIGWYVKKIVELMVQFYLKNGKFNNKGIIIAGPAEMKDLVINHDFFIQHFSKYLLKTLTVNEITDQSIHQVVKLATDILSSENNEKEIINNFEELLVEPKSTDLIMFGSNEVLAAFHKGDLKQILVANTYNYKDQILKSETKTKINLIKSTQFISKYGELVGIRYYSIYDEINMHLDAY